MAEEERSSEQGADVAKAPNMVEEVAVVRKKAVAVNDQVDAGVLVDGAKFAASVPTKA